MTEEENQTSPTPSLRFKMSDEKALKYIKDAILSGKSYKIIREYLKDNGFTDAQIEKLFAEHDNANQPDEPDDGSDGPS